MQRSPSHPDSRQWELLRSSGVFDPVYYLSANPDVAADGMDPLKHFALKGAEEGRHPFPGWNPADPWTPGAETAPENWPASLRRLFAAEPPRPSRDRDSVLVLTPRGARLGENIGDVAMALAALSRLAEVGSSARFTVLADDPPVLEDAGVSFRMVSSAALGHWLRDPAYAGARNLVDALGRAGTVVASGHGAMVDCALEDSLALLRLLHAAVRGGARVGMLGVGLGPMTDPRLRAAARLVLPMLHRIHVREPDASPTLLAELGVDPERVRVTGDDAPRTVLESDPPILEGARDLGLSLRLGFGAQPEIIRRVEARTSAAAGEAGAEIQPLPIDPTDAGLLTRLGHPCELDRGPRDFLTRAVRCRAAVAGSYHAAVLSLSMGVPVVALAAGGFYQAKMRGLVHWFPRLCRVLDLDAAPQGPEIDAAIRWALERSDVDRRTGPESARRQSRLGDEALAEWLLER